MVDNLKNYLLRAPRLLTIIYTDGTCTDRFQMIEALDDAIVVKGYSEVLAIPFTSIQSIRIQ